jgi:thiol-disulfide isomerase/thioredoxin
MNRTDTHPIRYRFWPLAARTAHSSERRVALRAVLALSLLLITAALFAGGGQEPTMEPQASPPPPESRSSAQEVETPGDAPQTGEDTGADESLPPMDAETARALSAMGMMPFQEKIPSEGFQLKLLDGDESSLADHEGKLIFLNFWATWCPPCREEMPSMQALYDELREEGLEILAVNVLEDEETAAAFITEQGFTYPVLMDRSGRVMLRYGVRAYPTTYLIDRAGYVIGVRPGFHDWATDDVIEQMRTLLAAE